MASPSFFAHPQCPPNLHKLDGYFCENEQVSLPRGTQPGVRAHAVGSSIGAGSCSAWGACTGESRTPLQLWSLGCANPPPVPGVIHACTAVCAPAAMVPLPRNFPVHAVMVAIPCRLSHVCASAEMALMSHKSSLCMCAHRHGPRALQTLCVHGSLCRASLPRAHATGAVFPGLCAPSTRTWGCHPALPKPPPWALTHGCQSCRDTAPCSPGPMLWWALQNPRPAVQRAVGPQ